METNVIVLETERLSLRRLHSDDAAFILELLNEPSFIHNIGDKGVRTISDAGKYILDGPVTSYNRFGFGLYLVELKDSFSPIGICGLVKRDALPDVDIGFAFLPQFWSMGYAFESALAVKSYGMTTLGLKRIVAIANPGNQASINVLKKIGLAFEKMVRLTEDGSEITLYASNTSP